MQADEFNKLIPSIPVTPGIYRYYDNKGVLLYVGKAKNLKNRISSYFSGKPLNQKTRELVKRIHKIEFTIVPTESDALFLENTLIKKYQPVFNIELKDDKTYPYIVIKNERFPRIFLTRRKMNDGSEYLGPYSSAGKVRELIDFIRQNLPIRNCNLVLSEKNILSNKFKKCLEYQLGNCNAPCEGLQSEATYMENVGQIKNLLNGRLESVVRFLKKEMKAQAVTLNFEKAAILQKKIQYLENYQSKSTVVNANIKNADVFYIQREGDKAFVNCLMVRNGTVIESYNTEAEAKVDESDVEILEIVIHHIRHRLHSTAEELILPYPLQWHPGDIKVTVPQKGEKKKLLEMSQLNAKHLLQEYKRKKSLHLISHTQNSETGILSDLQKILNLKNLPVHIECFDNSNFQGSYPVAAMVCFINGKASKKDYRRFNIKTVAGINDFASMQETVYRRYTRLKNEKKSLPQLVIIDGGKGQLNAAYESIRQLGLNNEITLVGLAKNVEEIFFIGDHESLKLPINHPVLLFIRNIRDEVHRFGISFHRNKRSKETFKTTLSAIHGIGEKTANELLRKFGSVEAIKKAKKNELEQLIGLRKATLIATYLK
ncbi:MAG: excinuclease ABC subunit UvrC [Bacteroidota bacterium]